MGLGKTSIFCKKILIFSIRLCPIVFVCVCVDPKWHFNMYLGKISIYSCIVSYVNGKCAF